MDKQVHCHIIGVIGHEGGEAVEEAEDKGIKKFDI